MIIDKQARFDWDNAITSTRVSTDTYDLTTVNRDIGLADDLYLVGVVTEAFTAAGAATLTVDLVDDDNAALSSPTTLQQLMAVTGKASLIIGFELFKTRIQINKITQRFIGLNWTVATGPMTAGKVRAFITPAIDAQRYYPRGYVVF